MILQHIARIGRIGLDYLINAAVGEAACADDIGNMDPLHPVDPLQLDPGLNRYLNFVNDHRIARTILSALALIMLAPYRHAIHD